MRPTGNHLLVQEELFEKLDGIYLTEGMKTSLMMGRPRIFRVLAKGPGRMTRKGFLIPIECEVGDRVITYSHTKGPVDLPDGRHMITEDEIIAVMPKQP